MLGYVDEKIVFRFSRYLTKGGSPAMTFAKKIIDYLTGLAAVGLLSLSLLILHVLFPKNGEHSFITLFGASFWTAWLTLMAIFAVVFFAWVFFFYKNDFPKRQM